MAIDPKLVSIIPASQLPTGDPTNVADFLFYEGNALKKGSMSNIYDKVSSGIKGVATTTTVPEATGFHRYLVHTAGTYTNFKTVGNASITVTAADLDIVSGVARNEVVLEVNNGVVTKWVTRKMGETGPVSNEFAVTKPESFNIISEGSVWKINFLAQTVAFGNETYRLTNVADQTLILDAPVYNHVYINKTTRLFEKYNSPVLQGATLVFVAVVAPTFDLFFSRCPYAVNGKPYNISTSLTAFSLTLDTPLVSNTISFQDEKETAFYKDSLFRSLEGGKKANVVLETMVGGQFKRYDIHNPTYLKASQIGTNVKFVIEGAGYVPKLWKNVTKIYKGLTTQPAKTVKLMGIGDSLYQGNDSTNFAPLALLKDKFAPLGITIQTVGTFNQDDERGIRSDIISEGRGYWSYKSFTGKDNKPYNTPITIATGTGLTTKFQNPFLRLATATDKANNPTWCFSNSVANPADPDGVSYATNPGLTNYYIFDFAYYMTRRSLPTPDVITMSLGINDWQEDAINVTDEFLCFQIMYAQIRAALPTVKLIVTPTNGIMPTNQLAWETEMFPLAERIIKDLEAKQAADPNLHICPIYAHISRQNAGAKDASTADLSATNNIKSSTTTDVHVLDKASSRLEYMQPLENVILAIIQ